MTKTQHKDLTLIYKNIYRFILLNLRARFRRVEKQGSFYYWIRGLPGKSHALNGFLLPQRVIKHWEYYRKRLIFLWMSNVDLRWHRIQVTSWFWGSLMVWKRLCQSYLPDNCGMDGTKGTLEKKNWYKFDKYRMGRRERDAWKPHLLDYPEPQGLKGHQAEWRAVQAWLEHSRRNSLGPAEAVKGWT